MKILCFLLIVFSSQVLASEKALPIGTFKGINLSLEKNGKIILSQKELHYHDSNLKIKKISPDIYELTISVYLQSTKDSKAVRAIRVDRYKVMWNNRFMGTLINEKAEHKRELSEFLLSNGMLIIKSSVAANGIIETQTYKIDK